MHTFSETGTGVPAFLAKLWRLVDDPDTNNLICWSKDGRSFIIQNQAQFARELLPLNYKHNNMASFIRQLNMYGFHKITSIDNGGLKFDRDEMEFSHPCFKRNCPYLLEHIKRKIANTKNIDEKAAALKPEAVTKVLQDVKAMRGRQDSLDSRFSVMKQENEALWREIASLRQKHAKQQQIVNKLIQFLITIVQPSRNMTSVKRHMQLMINDTPEHAKMRKTSETESDCGPVIHELGEELLEEVAEDAELLNLHSSYTKVKARLDTDSPSLLHIERPHSSHSVSSSQHFDYSNESVEDVLNSVASGSKAQLSNSSIIQSVNPDGSSIVYHVTEVPDAQPHEQGAAATLPNYNEENVLTTPLARQEMARTQLLKQKNKQRRREDDAANGEGAKVYRPAAAQRRAAAGASERQFNIKAEQKELDPLLMLNIYPNSGAATPEPQLFSPNINEDSLQSGAQAGNGLVGSTLKSNILSAADLYSQDDEYLNIPDDMPADIFQDSPLLAGENSNISDNYKMNQQQTQQELQKQHQVLLQQEQVLQQKQQELQQQQRQLFGLPTGVSAGKFATQSARGTSANGASTSAAAAAAAAKGATATSAQGRNGSNLAVTKYKNGVPHEEMRDEVNGHLDNVQDELESLKDLLRSDGYSLDANTLLGLFNDSDILGPYGLHMANEASNDRKGSELMTYQPLYDLSDMMAMNEKNDLDDANSVLPALNETPPTRSGLNTPTSTTPAGGRSVLNTPHHE